MIPHLQEQEHKHPLPLWVRLAIVLSVPLLTVVGAVLWIIQGSWAIIPTVLFAVLTVLLALFQLLPSLFPSGRHRDSTMIPPQPVSDDQHVSPTSPLFPPPVPPAQTYPAGITSPPQNPATTTSQQHEQAAQNTAMSGPKVDWGEAPQVGQFYGREQELAEMKQWILSDRCRVVAVLGIGGIGKTTLAALLAEQLTDQFEYVFWRSLQNAPPLENILKNCIQCFSNQQRIDLSGDIDGQITMLVGYLRDHRCLLVLDNLETILQAGNRAGLYREGYETYSRLLMRIGEGKHQSCLVLTSREKPKELTQLEGKTAPVRVLFLGGLKQAEGQELLKDKGLLGSEQIWAKLIHLYSGNPLALKLVSEPIRDVFGGDVARFLKKGEVVVGDISDVLDQQFTRLSDLEREIMYWLAIEREAVSLDELQGDIVHPMAKGALIEALRSLLRRSMIESSGIASFTLQPVIMEFVTDRFVERVAEEIETDTIELFGSYALIKVQTKDYVRESQARLILMPVAERLLGILGKEGIEKKLNNMLTILREASPQKAEYAAGNILNLLIWLHSNLRGYDFSHLTVRQADLRNVLLPQASFSYTDLTGSVFTDTFGGILCVVFSPQGDLLAAGTRTGEIRVWHATSGLPLHTLWGHTNWVHSVAFSPDGKILASGGDDRTVRLWEVSSGQCLALLHGHTSTVWSVAFSPDGSTLASSGDDRTVRLWEASVGKLLNTLQGHTQEVRSVAFSPDGELLASGSADQMVRLWKVNNGQCLNILQGHSQWVNSVAFSPDGKILASSGDDRTVRLWEVSSGQCLAILHDHSHWVNSVAFSLDGKILASGSDDQMIHLWEVSSGKLLNTLQGHTSTVRSVAFSSDGKILASGGDDQTVRLWEVSSGQCLAILHGHTSTIRSVAFSTVGNVLASSGDDQMMCLWEVSSGKLLNMQQAHSRVVYSVAFSPDGETLASGSADQTVRLWEMRSGQCLYTLKSDRPYERMNITQVKGLTEAQKATLKALGAVEDEN